MKLLSRLSCVGCAMLVLSSVPPRDAGAQRRPILPQIKLPHSYYYREMYLPQVTSGPSSVAWSPDGNEIAIAMQGSLWRHRLGTTYADQIAWGPGYAHQPDWSRDGKFIAYSWYSRDAIDLKLVNVATGESVNLVADGAVNLEPRWSPDGRRIAFTSTRVEGRFHIFTIDVHDGRPGSIDRLTTDHDSQLPRYYYGPFDHFLSPSWSPDGRELVLVSNAGRVWGTGGFWRIDARPGAQPREIHYEETTWKGKPDWSPDGRRIVYSSYAGRPWHQLWLMTADGGDVFPLTYGDFDATSARWSPDGRRIAYISNEGGNTSLWTIDVPGGHRQRVELRERRFHEPVGHVTISIIDGATRGVLPARVSVTSADGRGFAPYDAWRHADDSFDRHARPLDYSYFHTTGRAELTVPAGRITVEAMHGLQFGVQRRDIVVAPGGTYAVTIPLMRISDLTAEGWRSGDLHVHMNYGGTYRNTPARLALQGRAEDLDVIENLVVNKEQRIPDQAYVGIAPSRPLTSGPLIAHGQEFHTSVWGHLGLLGLKDHLLLPDYAGYVNTAAASLYPHNPAVIDMAHAQGAIAGYVHPFDDVPDPANRSVPLSADLPVAAALGAIDYMEVVGFSDHRASASVWYRLLNCGFRIPAGAGTDAMANYASLRGPVGLNRVFVKTGPAVTHAAWMRGVKEGRTFATNGPLLRFTVNGVGPGSEIRLPAGRHELTITASLTSIVPVDRLEVVGNGEVVTSFPLTGKRTRASGERTIPIDRSGWYTLRAAGDRDAHPVLDLYPFATTSAIYVIVGNQRIQSPADARFFLTWLDRLEEFTKAHTGWNTDAERGLVLASISRARAVYRGQANTPD